MRGLGVCFKAVRKLDASTVVASTSAGVCVGRAGAKVARREGAGRESEYISKSEYNISKSEYIRGTTALAGLGWAWGISAMPPQCSGDVHGDMM